MKAIVCEAWGDPRSLRFRDVPRPALAPGQLRLRVRAAGVNFADTLMVAGRYQVKPPFPFSPGLECAGEVIECAPDVAGFRPGQRVLAVSRFGGSYAEELAIDARAAVPIPDAMDFATAAGFPVAYGTAELALVHRGALRPGETLIVAGAAGGVGLAAVEVGRALGARVVAIAGGPEKCAVAREHGAHATIDHRQEDVRERIKALTEGRGADVVLDPVGGALFEQCLRAVNWEARMLVVGFASGTIQAVPANMILLKNISVTGVVWGAQAARDPALTSARIVALLGWAEAGRLRPRISARFPLADAAGAMEALLGRAVPGKIVLEA